MFFYVIFMPLQSTSSCIVSELCSTKKTCIAKADWCLFEIYLKWLNQRHRAECTALIVTTAEEMIYLFKQNIIYSLVSKYQPEINPWLVLWFQVILLLLWHKVHHYDSLIQMKTAADEYKVSLVNYHQDRQILHQGNSILSVYRWKL